MIINAVGCPYSGVEALETLIASTGARTRSGGPDLVLDRRLVDRRVPYDCNDIPKWVTDWITKFDLNGMNDYMHRKKEFFHNTWCRFSVMYALEQKYPSVRFLIILRDPRRVIGNWYHIDGNIGPEITIETYKNTVLKIYAFMSEQIDLMKNKPIVMDYDLFLKGHYLKYIFETFGVEKSLENFHAAQGFLKKAYVDTESYDGDINEILFYKDKLEKWLIS